MAVDPVVNPHYHKVKPKADSWIQRYASIDLGRWRMPLQAKVEIGKPDFEIRVLQADDKWAARNTKVDLAYLASIWAPYCDEEALRMMVDWNHWVCTQSSIV